MSDPSTLEAIREIIARHGRLAAGSFADSDDLYQVGLTSLATVGVMLALEEQFDIEFPESKLSRATFRSIEAIAETIDELVAAGPTA